MKKKLLNLGLIMAISVLFAGYAVAADPDTMTLSVTVSATLSVSITGDPYNFEAVSLNSSTMSTRAITVTNDSTNAIEDYQLSCTPPGGWTASADATPGSNEFVLQALFNSVQPATGDFGANDVVDNTAQRADATTYFVGDQDGDTIATSGVVSLWFRLQTPTSSSLSGAQNITLTVDAELAD